MNPFCHLILEDSCQVRMQSCERRRWNMNSTSEEFNQEERIILAAWFSVTGLVAVIGNTVVLWLIARNHSLRIISNFFIASLAVADLSVGLVINPVWATARCINYDEDSYLKTYGKAIDYLWIHTTVATTFNLCCISLDRYIAIIHPLRYQELLTNTRSYLIIASVWVLSFLLPCSRFFVRDDSIELWLSFTIITVLIPMIVIVFCSTRILKASATQSRRMNVVTLQNQESVNRRKQNLKAAKTVSIVVGLFVVCWLPSLVTSFTQYLSENVVYSTMYHKVWTIVEAVAFTSAAIDPWVYCLRNSKFYEAFNRTFRVRGRQIIEQTSSRR